MNSNTTPQTHLGLVGKLQLTITRDGVPEIWEGHNLIVDTGYVGLSQQLGVGGTDKVITQISAGTNGSTPIPADTAITAAFTKAVSGVTYPGNDVQFSFVIEESEGNGNTYREFGLLFSDNVLFSRLVRAPIIKDNTVRIEGTWTITA